MVGYTMTKAPEAVSNINHKSSLMLSDSILNFAAAQMRE